MWVSVLRAKVKPVAGVAEVGRIRVTDQRAPRERPAPENPPPRRRGPSVSSRARIASKTCAYPTIRLPACLLACLRSAFVPLRLPRSLPYRIISSPSFFLRESSSVLLWRRDHPPFSFAILRLCVPPSSSMFSTTFRSVLSSSLSSPRRPTYLSVLSPPISLSSRCPFVSLVVLSLAAFLPVDYPADTTAYLLDYLVLGTGYSVPGTRYTRADHRGVPGTPRRNKRHPEAHRVRALRRVLLRLLFLRQLEVSLASSSRFPEKRTGSRHTVSSRTPRSLPPPPRLFVLLCSCFSRLLCLLPPLILRVIVSS